MKRFKLWLISAIVVLLAGIAVFAFLGFNQTPDYKDAYQLSVKVDANIVNASTILKEKSDGYLSSKGIKVADYNIQLADEGGMVIYKFAEDVSDKIALADLENAVKDGMKDSALLSSLKVSAEWAQTKSFANNTAWIILAAGLAVVATFVYALIMEKCASALSIVITSICSGLLTFAIIALVRVPARPFLYGAIATASVLSALFTTVMVNRFNESVKNVGNNKKSYKTIAEEGTKNSLLRVCFVACALFVFALAIGIICGSYLRFLAIQLLIADVSATFASLCFGGSIWASIRSHGKARKTEESKENA